MILRPRPIALALAGLVAVFLLLPLVAIAPLTCERLVRKK